MEQPGTISRGRLPNLDQLLSLLRWVAIAVVFVLAWANPDRPTHIALLLAVYNAVLSVVLARSPLQRAPWSLFAADVAMVSLVLGLSGGLDSPAYIVYYLSVIGLARHQGLAKTNAATIAVAVIYGSVCLIATPGDWLVGRWETLLARITLLLGVGFIAGVLMQELKLQEEASREERERAAQWRELERVQSDLLSMVSHEFKTPLTAIRTASDLLLASPESLSQTQIRLLDNIQRNERRLAGLVNDLLDMARLESGQLALNREALSVGEVLQESVSALRPMAEVRDQQIQLDVPADLPVVWADRRRVGQILANLLSNALYFSPPGGLVQVQVRALDHINQALAAGACGAAPALPAAADGGKWVGVSVADSGPGIPEHEQKLIFDRFYRGSQRRTGGTGLGLSIARSLVGLHGGRIWLDSVVGRGSVFHVELPAAAAQTAEAE